MCECIVVPVSNGTFVHTKSIQTPTEANLFSSQDIFIAFSFRCLSRVFLLPDPFRVLFDKRFNSIQFTAMNKSQHDQIESTALIHYNL